MSHDNIARPFERNVRQPAAALRKIAEDIESGKYGHVECLSVVLMGDTVEVFGAGKDCEPSSVATLLYAGFMRLMDPIANHGRWR